MKRRFPLLLLLTAIWLMIGLAGGSGCPAPETPEECQDRCNDEMIACRYDCTDELAPDGELNRSVGCTDPQCQGEDNAWAPVMPCCTSCCDTWWECYRDC